MQAEADRRRKEEEARRREERKPRVRSRAASRAASRGEPIQETPSYRSDSPPIPTMRGRGGAEESREAAGEAGAGAGEQQQLNQAGWDGLAEL